MNQEAQAELDRILALDPADLTDAEREFLQARRSYLTEEQRINFGITEGQNSDVDPNDKPDYGKGNKSELQTALQERGITFEDSYKKDVLIAMLEQSDAGLTPHVVTKEDLTNNPELAGSGVKVGEVIGLPTEDAR